MTEDNIHALITARIKEIGLSPVCKELGGIHPPHMGRMYKAGEYNEETVKKYREVHKIPEPVPAIPEIALEGSHELEQELGASTTSTAPDEFTPTPEIPSEPEAVDSDSSQDSLDDLDIAAATQNASWTGKRLAICFPCYRQTNPVTNFALMALFDKTKMRYLQRHNTQIVKARNALADMFLKSGCEWSFWLDDDMIPPIGNAEWFYAQTKKDKRKFPATAAGHNAILRLHNMAKQSGKHIVSALYFGRNSTGRAMFAEALRNDDAGRNADREARRDAGKPHAGLKQTAWAATGCVLVHRDVFLAVFDCFPELQPKNKKLPFQYFTPDSNDPGGEDRAFFQRASKCGFQSYVDLGCVAGHVGYSVYTDENTKWEKTT